MLRNEDHNRPKFCLALKGRNGRQRPLNFAAVMYTCLCLHCVQESRYPASLLSLLSSVPPPPPPPPAPPPHTPRWHTRYELPGSLVTYASMSSQLMHAVCANIPLASGLLAYTLYTLYVVQQRLFPRRTPTIPLIHKLTSLVSQHDTELYTISLSMSSNAASFSYYCSSILYMFFFF